MARGLVHVYCGDGKGKTTAAMGLAVRMAGSGGRVIIFQFLKNNSSSERKALSQLDGIHLMDGFDKVKFTFKMNEAERRAANAFYEEKLFELSRLISGGGYDMAVLDEVIGAVEKGFLKKESVLEFLDSRPENTEIVMTGRNPCEELLERADYVTEMKKVKHPFDSGTKGRLGIEF